jgi:long-chain fatty acid transport protein
MDKVIRTRLLHGVALAVTLGMTSLLQAAGFQLSEQSATGLGRAFAGGGVAGDDASDIFYNPAGMMLNENRQFQIGAHYLDISAPFSNTGSTRRLFTGAGFATIPSQGSDSDAGVTAFAPNVYYIAPRRGNFQWGLTVTAPFGLSTEYEDDWVGRYHAIKSEVITVDINPSIAYAISDSVSLGVGISAQYADAELSRAVFTGPGRPDGKAVLNADNWDFGFNAGIMITPGERTRLGISYRSRVEQGVSGDAVISGTGIADGTVGIGVDVTMPETVYLSLAQDITESLTLLASGRWTKWSRFEELRIVFDNGSPDDVTVENWDDQWMFSIGLDWAVNERWMLRVGYAMDESVISSEEFRTPRIPDSNRTWYTVGASFSASDRLNLDLGYARIEGDSASLQNTVNLVSAAPGLFTDTLVGEYNSPGTNIFSVQIHMEF